MSKKHGPDSDNTPGAHFSKSVSKRRKQRKSQKKARKKNR